MEQTKKDLNNLKYTYAKVANPFYVVFDVIDEVYYVISLLGSSKNNEILIRFHYKVKNKEESVKLCVTLSKIFGYPHSFESYKSSLFTDIPKGMSYYYHDLFHNKKSNDDLVKVEILCE